MYDFVDAASENPTFYADLTNPQSLNKYQYTYNNPLNLSDNDGHCPTCVVVVVVVVIELLSAPDTVNAPTGHPGEVLAPSGDGVKTLMANATMGAIGGPILSKGSRSLMNFAAGREAAKVVGGAVERQGAKQAAQRGSRTPEVAKGAPKPVEGSSGGPGAGRRPSASTKDKIRARDNDTCVYCGSKTTRQPGPKQSNIDHSDPMSRNGDTTDRNLQNTCRDCNQMKRAKTNKEFLNPE